MYVKSLPRHEQYEMFLKVAGWYEGRTVDITAYKEMASSRFVELTPASYQFIASYANLEPNIQFCYEEGGDSYFDFDFRLNIEAADIFSQGQDYQSILRHAQEKCLCIGIMGHYYAGVLAIGESGTLYLKHDYNDHVQQFTSMLDIIASELSTCKTIVDVRKE